MAWAHRIGSAKRTRASGARAEVRVLLRACSLFRLHGGRSNRAAARVTVAVALCASILLPRDVRGQTCGEPHYRWSEKTDTTLATLPAAPVDIPRILTSWAPPSITRAGWCASRSGREDSVFMLTGWVRRIQLDEVDGDWHIELTEGASTPVTACIIVEIPAERYGAAYRVARAAL